MSLLILVSIFSCAAAVMYLVYRNFPELSKSVLFLISIFDLFPTIIITRNKFDYSFFTEYSYIVPAYSQLEMFLLPVFVFNILM